jgi:hypothetical protein
MPGIENEEIKVVRSKSAVRLFAGVILFILLAPPVKANGPLSVDGTGQVMRWDNSAAIVYNPDLGTLGTLTNAQADALLADAFGRWQGLALVQLTFTAGAELAQDVNAIGLPSSNPAHWGHFWRQSGDGISPVVYDTDGSVTDDMFGIGAKYDILGAAGLDTPISLSGVITEGSIVLNGLFLDGLGLPASPDDSPSQLAFEATMVHEVGHFLNFNHSMVNHELAGDFDPSNDIFLATMYPLTADNEEAIASPNPDDIAAAIALYPAPGAATATWSIAGTVSDVGGVPFQGAEVTVRRNANPLLYAYEGVSGASYFPCNVGGACYPCDGNTTCSPGNPPAQGAYSIQGMEPGDYTVRVEQMDRRISLENGTFIGPLPTPPVLPGPEECYNTGDGADPTLDDPNFCTTLTQAAGSSATGIDVQLDDFPVSDSFEPNDSLAAAAVLPGAQPGQPGQTIGAVLGTGDKDFYKMDVVTGHRYEIDVDAAEIGSPLDPILALYDNTGTLIQVVDDGVDPDSGMATADPALTYEATFSGLLRIALSSYPDSDMSGDGVTNGSYWLRVVDNADADGDGIADRFDAFPVDPLDDADGDGFGANLDNCPTLYNPTQTNADGDAYGDACDSNHFLSARWAYFTTGLSAGAHLGTSLASGGHSNEDGREDVLAGSPDYNDGNGGIGRVELLYGMPSRELGGLLYTFDGNSIPPGAYGTSVALMGDMNHDGFDDLVIGEPTDRFAEAYYGGTSFEGQTFARDWFGYNDPATVHYGQQVDSAGDVNGDGATDLIVSDPDYPGGGTNRGKVYLYLGTPGPSWAAPDDTEDQSILGGVDGQHLGQSIAGVGDVDGNGFDDVLVGIPGLTNGQPLEGRAVLYTAVSTFPYLSASLWEVESNEISAGLGTVVAKAGDVNGDGVQDFMVAAPNMDAGGTDRGRVLVFLGSASALPSTTPNQTLSGDQNSAHFGAAMAGIGDVNNDGYDDIAVGAPDYDVNGTDRGRVYVYLGSSTGITATPTKVINGIQNLARFGSSVAGIDTDGDGLPELVVGSKGYDTATRVDAGRVDIFAAFDGEDRDGDGFGDPEDNCPFVYNPTQSDTDTAAGPDGICGTHDDSPALFGLNGACGGGDDFVGDGVGDACVSWPLLGFSGGFTAAGYRSSGAAWGDYDGDGDLDLWLTGFAGGSIAERLLRNDGSGSFVDVTAAPFGGSWINGAWADFNNDGRLDLASVSDSSLRLLQNNGAGSFTSVTLPVVTSPAWLNWVDYDGDQDLDLYAATGASGGRFLRNDGGTTFTLVVPTGLDSADHTVASWSDYDQDGDQDVFIGQNSCLLYDNLGGGAFAVHGVQQVWFCTNPSWGDYDNDGDADVQTSWQVLRNDGGGVMTPVDIFSSGLGIPAWGDYDNDGDLDALQGVIFRNDGGNVFRRTEEISTRPYGAANQAVIDYDNDGKLDEFVAGTSTTNQACRIAHNTTPSTGHWLEIDLVGTVSNRSAVGAWVLARTGGVTRTRTVSSGSASGPLRVHFGLADARVVDKLEIRWPSGTVQTYTDIPVNQRMTITEVDGSSPTVTSVSPPNGAVDVSLYTNVIVQMNKVIDPSTADIHGIVVSRNGIKVDGSIQVSTDRLRVTFDPDGPLEADSDYTVQVTNSLRDSFGNPATPFASVFDSGPLGGSVPIPANQVGGQQSGTVLVGVNQDERSGFSAAMLGDVNDDGIADWIAGAPNADDGASVDAGVARLVLGNTGSTAVTIEYRGEGEFQLAGKTVASAGDMNGDGISDFLIAAPYADPNGDDSGKVYLVFGNGNLEETAPATFSLSALSSCATPTLCGVVFEGEAQGDLAGFAMTGVGDINNDGFADLVIGAPVASPSGRTAAGKIYLLYGPFLSAGVIPLSTVGVSQPGVVFIGEAPGDLAGTAVSRWDQFTGDGIDDMLITAPGADALDDFGNLIPDAGYVYAIHGGPANLIPDPVSPATIDLARLANGAGNQVGGMVFIGAQPNRQIGRSVTGVIDINADGVPDIAIGARGEAYLIPGIGPKTQSGTSKLDPTPTITPTGYIRPTGQFDALQQFGATFFTSGTEGNLGDIVVAAAGDINGDGFPDLILGAGEADLPGKPDAGKAYVIFGSQDFPSGEVPLSEVGVTLPGTVILGAEAGDHLGAAVGGGFDVNGDGAPDILVGAPFADSAPSAPDDAGETYIISFGVPGEVVEITVLEAASPPDSVFLEWTPAPRALSYNVYRGSLSALSSAAELRTSAMSQIACGIAADSDVDQLPDMIDTGTPPLGDGFFYLVTGRNVAGEGTLGAPDVAQARIHDAQCP